MERQRDSIPETGTAKAKVLGQERGSGSFFIKVGAGWKGTGLVIRAQLSQSLCLPHVPT